MNKELDKIYDPQKYEDYIYKKWEESDFFNPDTCVSQKICSAKASTYAVVLPPPNITDKLHLGHVVMVAVTDILVRYNRMNGKKALWIPGTDHAAIATQNVVEKKIWQESEQTRHDLGRKKFLKKVDEFVQVTQSTIINQLQKTGASMDWSRLAFTLDDKRQMAVKQMFTDMYNEGVIYRGYRIVNWCPRCQSTLADDEIEYKEQKTKLYTFKYAKNFPLTISTTRPETKLGDTAVAVHPDDDRYRQYIGQEIDVNFCGINLRLKIIADKRVDPNFGTGALGVTPAHSMVDYDMAQKNSLTIKKVIDESGHLMNDLNEFSGKSVTQARDMVVEKLKTQGLLESVEDIKNNLSVCYRCDTAIEPLTSKQWFVNVNKKLARLDEQSLKEKAIAAAQTGQVKFAPERFTKRYLDWMENLHDWCISRQIWYGHQIPAWYKGEEVYVGVDKPQGDDWQQDEDVLDTWFSSGMWTFSTLGWPQETADLKTYHPNQLLDTGYEIITLWVSRMIMMSFFALNEIPFETVYLHGMVLDAQGKKMSKSKGNGIDPVEMFKKYGTDATRLSLIIGNTPGNDTRMSEVKIAEFRNFVNKLWNIARYIIINAKPDDKDKQVNIKTAADQWIWRRLRITIKEVSQKIECFEFSAAGEILEEFTWNDFADWYLEIAKFEPEDKGPILRVILETILKLWHPFMPFITEAIWQELDKPSLLMVELWPLTTSFSDAKYKINEKKLKASEKNILMLKNIIITIRNIRSEYKIKPSKKIAVVIYAGDKTTWVKNHKYLLENLRTGVEVEVKDSGEKLHNAAYVAIDNIEIYIPLQDLVDIGKEAERLQKRATELKQLIDNVDKKVTNPEFVRKAPKEIIETEIAKQSAYHEEWKKIKEQIKHLK